MPEANDGFDPLVFHKRHFSDDEYRVIFKNDPFGVDETQLWKTADFLSWTKVSNSIGGDGDQFDGSVEMVEDDLVYRDEHPVNWCPRCETAIADAEVEKEDRTGTLYYVTFPGVDNDEIEIATTRPELLAACVGMAVDPEDERYEDRIGETFEVPLFGQEVELIADDDVDGDFGTGAVMVCTFGDKQDVTWWSEHDLDLRAALDEDGTLNELGGEFAGMAIDEAKEAIAERLDDEGFLNDSEPTEQSVGTCWRCDTPIEILSKEQWFVRVDQDEILEKAREVEWVPEHMYQRLEEWTEGMDWDWVVSRQRVFATPIPAWFCEDCGHAHVASEEEVPVEPTETDPAVGECPECGATEWRGEADVMDTWMDSSISPLYVAGWPDEEFEPVQLREQGHDIIRTWAFYTILRTAALEDDIPWEEALVNGMVFGEDGNKMSKSRGNFVQPEEAVEEYSADAFRQAMALGGQPGSDIQFQWKEVTSASRFLTKVWNISKFATNHFDERTPETTDPAYRDADQWILTRAADTAETVGAYMDEYRFDAALRELREFVWHDLADDYLELIKGRLYEGRPGERDDLRAVAADHGRLQRGQARGHLVAVAGGAHAHRVQHPGRAHLAGLGGRLLHRFDPAGVQRADVDHQRVRRLDDLVDLLARVRHHRRGADGEQDVRAQVHGDQVGDRMHQRVARAHRRQRVGNARGGLAHGDRLPLLVWSTLRARRAGACR